MPRSSCRIRSAQPRRRGGEEERQREAERGRYRQTHRQSERTGERGRKRQRQKVQERCPGLRAVLGLHPCTLNPTPYTIPKQAISSELKSIFKKNEMSDFQTEKRVQPQPVLLLLSGDACRADPRRPHTSIYKSRFATPVQTRTCSYNSRTNGYNGQLKRVFWQPVFVPLSAPAMPAAQPLEAPAVPPAAPAPAPAAVPLNPHLTECIY